MVSGPLHETAQVEISNCDPYPGRTL